MFQNIYQSNQSNQSGNNKLIQNSTEQTLGYNYGEIIPEKIDSYAIKSETLKKKDLENQLISYAAQIQQQQQLQNEMQQLQLQNQGLSSNNPQDSFTKNIRNLNNIMANVEFQAPVQPKMVFLKLDNFKSPNTNSQSQLFIQQQQSASQNDQVQGASQMKTPLQQVNSQCNQIQNNHIDQNQIKIFAPNDQKNQKSLNSMSSQSTSKLQQPQLTKQQLQQQQMQQSPKENYIQKNKNNLKNYYIKPSSAATNKQSSNQQMQINQTQLSPNNIDRSRQKASYNQYYSVQNISASQSNLNNTINRTQNSVESNNNNEALVDTGSFGAPAGRKNESVNMSQKIRVNQLINAVDSQIQLQKANELLYQNQQKQQIQNFSNSSPQKNNEQTFGKNDQGQANQLQQQSQSQQQQQIQISYMPPQGIQQHISSINQTKELNKKYIDEHKRQISNMLLKDQQQSNSRIEERQSVNQGNSTSQFNSVGSPPSHLNNFSNYFINQLSSPNLQTAAVTQSTAALNPSNSNAPIMLQGQNSATDFQKKDSRQFSMEILLDSASVGGGGEGGLMHLKDDENNPFTWLSFNSIERNEIWLQLKKQKLQLRINNVQDEEMKNCTFQPQFQTNRTKYKPSNLQQFFSDRKQIQLTEQQYQTEISETVQSPSLFKRLKQGNSYVERNKLKKQMKTDSAFQSVKQSAAGKLN